MSQNASSIATATRLHAVAIQLLRRVRRDDPVTGLSAPRASALSVLVFGGARSIGELATAEQVTAPTMTRLIAGLERAGYVTRRSDPEDGRVVRVSATARGRRVLEAGRDRRVQHVLAILDQLKPAEVDAIERAVSLLERALAASS